MAETAKTGTKPTQVTQEYFTEKFPCEKFFMRPKSMRITKEAHRILRQHYDLIKIDLQEDKLTVLMESTLHDVLKFPWYLDKLRRTLRRPSGNIEKRVLTMHFYGDREAALFLKLLNGDMARWTHAMTNSRIQREIIEPLPLPDWDPPAANGSIDDLALNDDEQELLHDPLGSNP